jgi:hypothetical protein
VRLHDAVPATEGQQRAQTLRLSLTEPELAGELRQFLSDRGLHVASLGATVVVSLLDPEGAHARLAVANHLDAWLPLHPGVGVEVNEEPEGPLAEREPSGPRTILCACESTKAIPAPGARQ